MIKSTSRSAFYVAAFAILSLSSCKKDDPKPEPEQPAPAPAPGYTVPSTYEFGANADFSAATQRINMMKELVAYVRSTHTATQHVVIESSKMRNMFLNTSSPFTDNTLNGSGVNIAEKTSNNHGEITAVNNVFDEAAAVSQTTVEGKDGQAGKVLGPVPSSSTAARAAYLFNAQGFEYKELVEKGLMGSFIYSEAMKIMHNISSFSNSDAVAGRGTSMEHAWDEAFAYYGVPAAFPTATTGLSYWGNYGNSVNAAIGCNTAIMNAFLKGRAAISNNDMTARDEAKATVIKVWEQVCAARMVAYLKGAKNNFANVGPRNHNLSEALGFIQSFKYNPSKKISDADISLLLGYLGSNLYNVSSANIDAMITKVCEVYNLDAAKL